MSSRGGNRVHFQALLEGALEGSRPLEARLLSFLIEMIDKMMGTAESEPSSLMCSPLHPSFVGFPVNPITSFSNRDNLEIANHAQGSEERQDIDSFIRGAAVKYDVDENLIRAVIQVESDFNPKAVSPAGAQGMMQLMPATAADLRVRDPFDPAQNIDGGTRYLKQLLDRYGGNRRLALAAYNWGMGHLEKNPDFLPQETRRYISKVEKAYRTWTGMA